MKNKQAAAMTSLTRGFPISEFQTRVAQAQALMSKAGLSALLLTTEPEIRYFSGFLTRFWESPTRPWFLVIPSSGAPIAVIPSIGAALMARDWITDIRTWQSPDYTDDGIRLLAATLCEASPTDGMIGVPSGPETHLRLPLQDWNRLGTQIGNRRFSDDNKIMQRLRMVKSSAEIGKIRHACQIADRAFQRVPEIAGHGVALSAVFRQFQALCLQEGADWVAYLAGAAGPEGYDDVISPATDTALKANDVLMLDTGVVWDGYFCDFDRNYYLSEISAEANSVYQKLLDAADAGVEIAKPGQTAANLFHAMDGVLTGGSGQATGGRLGHGLGMQLTEWPSLIPDDHTVLEPGMVLTLEPCLTGKNNRMLVHEENIVITATGAEYLSSPAPRTMPRLGDLV